LKEAGLVLFSLSSLSLHPFLQSLHCCCHCPRAIAFPSFQSLTRTMVLAVLVVPLGHLERTPCSLVRESLTPWFHCQNHGLPGHFCFCCSHDKQPSDSQLCCLPLDCEDASGLAPTHLALQSDSQAQAACHSSGSDLGRPGRLHFERSWGCDETQQRGDGSSNRQRSAGCCNETLLGSSHDRWLGGSSRYRERFPRRKK